MAPALFPNIQNWMSETIIHGEGSVPKYWDMDVWNNYKIKISNIHIWMSATIVNSEGSVSNIQIWMSETIIHGEGSVPKYWDMDVWNNYKIKI